ncbi:MAG: hypothetical protein A2942_02575 [Candidatus Lloydbacteria bacterium RIFCSPLOWO2_01_FULL_50_20]|uniref:POTRA domain-containing protein n=1 Tax=Candidatus Lloydbacteria bacterium RIFCSPLOWO2_01_FULL_50_20 TaxID=1798665 RepID=A0A1G2DFC6_9BACT|nr:MAG: hypothetical protein A3C13_01925 [Candidatus Lloydbacteria bacterium RIFCSPHIGHO2_02_FULL_50_11]OGZ12132.1 MAG: hypothetical protein A2942_02575 [Candidatus Lloydbacteria bacterium RIFCSPLOWO2_01_FULL_50_20]
MPIFRNTIRRSRREHLRRIDHAFEMVFRVLFVCYFLFIFSAWFSYRETFHIAEVEIRGVQAVDAGSVEGKIESQLARHLLWKIDRGNSILYPRSAMRSAILDVDSRVKDVTIAVEGKKLTAVISEYSPAFLWCPPENVSTTTITMRGCSFADLEGHIFSPAPEYSGDPFIVFATAIEAGKTNDVLPREEFDRVSTFLRSLSGLGLVPRVVRQSGEHDFLITTAEPWAIRWSSERDPAEDARNLALVLKNLNEDHSTASVLKAVDLRFGNKVFYR